MNSFTSFIKYLRRPFVGELWSLLREYFAVAGRVPAERRKEFAYWRHVTDKLRWQISVQSSPFYAFHSYRNIDHIVRRHQGGARRILELGPGSSLGVLFCFLAGGAERAVGADIAPIDRNPEFYRLLKDYLACVAGFKWWMPTAIHDSCPDVRKVDFWEEVDVDALLQRIEYRAPVTADKLPFGESEFDLVYSCAAMEHFDRPQEAVREMCRVLAPGGLAVHFIDLRNHGGTHPLDHLRWSEAEYSRRTEKYCDGRGIDQILEGEWKGEVFCNRLLAGAWKNIFLEAGLQILQFDVISQVDPATIDPSLYAAPFRNHTKEELAPLIIRVVAQRQAS
jgi:SAM-dependent methyltransferase